MENKESFKKEKLSRFEILEQFGVKDERELQAMLAGILKTLEKTEEGSWENDELSARKVSLEEALEALKEEK